MRLPWFLLIFINKPPEFLTILQTYYLERGEAAIRAQKHDYFFKSTTCSSIILESLKSAVASLVQSEEAIR